MEKRVLLLICALPRFFEPLIAGKVLLNFLLSDDLNLFLEIC